MTDSNSPENSSENGDLEPSGGADAVHSRPTEPEAAELLAGLDAQARAEPLTVAGRSAGRTEA